MLENLYKFKKNAWHVRLFKWIYKTDPTTTFKTMCPYFWSMVFTFSLFPIILLFKMFGGWGNNVLSKLESKKRDSIARDKKNLRESINNPDLTPKQAYDIKKSKCFGRYGWDIFVDNESENRFMILYWEWYHKLEHDENLKRLEQLNKLSKRKEIKESKWFGYVSLLITLSIFSIIGYTLYMVFSIIEFPAMDWELVGRMLFKISILSLISFILFITIKYILIPLSSYLKCVNLPKCSLCKFGFGNYIIKPFKFVGKGFLIIGDMIYVTYKRNCPLITWEEEIKK